MECKLKDKTIVSLEFDPITKYLGLDKTKTIMISGMKCWVYISGKWFWTPFSSLGRTFYFVQEFKSCVRLISALTGFKTKRKELNSKRI